MGLADSTQTTTAAEIGGGPLKVSRGRTSTTDSTEWPAALAAKVTERLLDDGKIAVSPDYSKRYFTGRMYAVAGIMLAPNQTNSGTWFVGVDDGALVLLHGSAEHLREARRDEAPTWSPSRLDDLASVLRSMSDFAGGDSLDTQAVRTRGPGQSHTDTVRQLMTALQDSVRRGPVALEGWVEFVAVKHFAIPWPPNEAFEQVVLGSPLWVSDYSGEIPSGWYPDPALQLTAGTHRYWDGLAWTDQAAVSGSEVTSPAPDAAIRPVGRLLPGQISRECQMY